MLSSHELPEKSDPIAVIGAMREDNLRQIFGDTDLNNCSPLNELYECLKPLVVINHTINTPLALLATFETATPLEMSETEKKHLADLSYSLDLDTSALGFGFIHQDQPKLAKALMAPGKLRQSEKQRADNLVSHIFAANIEFMSTAESLADDPFTVYGSAVAYVDIITSLVALTGDKTIAHKVHMAMIGQLVDISDKLRISDVANKMINDAMDKGGTALHDLFQTFDDDAKPILNGYLVTAQLKWGIFKLRSIYDNPLEKQRLYREALRVAEAAPFANLLASSIDPEHGSDQKTSVNENVLDLKPTELNWEVLPPGELTENAREIINNAQSDEREVKIDLDRLKTLEEIRELWGPDCCYYAKGTLKKRGKVVVDDLKQADEYIILVLQDSTPDGLVEHAVAESPIAGPHAMYIFRQDIAKGVTWRQAMSVDKKQARALGARQVKHTTAVNSDTMTNKACYLLACSPDEFRNLEFSGQRIKMPRAIVSLETTD